MAPTENLPAVLDSATNVIVVVNERRVCTYANAAVERLLGHRPATLVGEDLLGYVHSDDAPSVRATFDELVDAGRASTAEFRLGASDGSWLWFEGRFSPCGDRGGQYVVSATDISQRKALVTDRRRIERRLQQLTENTNNALWMFSDDWSELLFINSAFEDIWGLSVDALRERPEAFLEATHPDDREKVVDAMESLTAGESVDLEFRVNSEKNYRRWVWVQGEPIFEDGAVTCVVGSTRDITDRRRREQQLRVMDHLLRHNLRNDMNVILGQAQYAAERGDQVVESCAETISQTGERLLESAEKERDVVSVLTDGKTTRPVDIVEHVYDAVSQMRAEYPDASIDVDTPPTVEVSAVPKIRAAIQELLENAIVHTQEPDPFVEITLQNCGDSVELVITDNAPPIPEYEYETMTGDHEIGDLYHSSGLGLWLVYWLVELSDGELSFETSETCGNTIRIVLPHPST